MVFYDMYMYVSDCYYYRVKEQSVCFDSCSKVKPRKRSVTNSLPEQPELQLVVPPITPNPSRN